MDALCVPKCPTEWNGGCKHSQSLLWRSGKLRFFRTEGGADRLEAAQPVSFSGDIWVHQSVTRKDQKLLCLII
jgi:hypothetical protein